jgi:hypothetical protein
MSKAGAKHSADLLTFADGTEISRWEYEMEFYPDLPDDYTVTPFAERTDLEKPPAEDQHLADAIEMFEEEGDSVDCTDAFEYDEIDF